MEAQEATRLTEAQAWTREDWIAIVLSPIVYALIMFGLVNVLLLRGAGFTMLFFAVAGSAAIYWVIDPKLRAMSLAFEQAQGDYLEKVDQKTRWAGH